MQLKLSDIIVKFRILSCSFRSRVLIDMAAITDETSDKFQSQVELEEELTCSSCGNLFVEPKTLSCSHTFCAKCIDDNLIDDRAQPNYQWFPINFKKFVCFICKASFSKEKLEKVSKNISMESLITIVKKRRAYVKAISEKDENASDLTVTCTQCEENTPATWWCLTCDDAEICPNVIKAIVD